MVRKEKKYHFIYKTTNLLSGKYYIGMHSTDDLNDGYMGSGKRLRYSVNKYGKEKHKVEILEFFDTRAELKARELEIVNLNEIAKEECLNLVVGGEGGRGFTKEERQMGAKVTNKLLKDRWENDKEFSDRMKKILLDNSKKAHMNGNAFAPPSFKGKSHSEETKNKMRKSKNNGSTNSQFGTCWITNGEEVKKIKKEDLEQHLQNGWRIGRK